MRGVRTWMCELFALSCARRPRPHDTHHDALKAFRVVSLEWQGREALHEDQRKREDVALLGVLFTPRHDWVHLGWCWYRLVVESVLFSFFSTLLFPRSRPFPTHVVGRSDHRTVCPVRVVLRSPFVRARAEISNLRLEAGRHENVVRLEVAVDDSHLAGVEVAHSLDRADEDAARKLVVPLCDVHLLGVEI